MSFRIRTNFRLASYALFCFCLLIVFAPLKSQAEEDFDWWVKIHNWDGHTSWHQYMTMSTSFMGPNALPVPEVKTGSLPTSLEIEQLAGAHFSKGDHTQDFFSRGYLPLFSNRIALEMYVVPLEFFKTDTITRDIRAARGRSGKGSAGGDIYFSTNVQVLRDLEGWPDIELDIAMRTASGTNLRNARYTDASGYFMDLSFGKNLLPASEDHLNIRVYAMGGFYSYQTYTLEHLQNDTWLAGGGCSISGKKLELSQSVGGYHGYLRIGDRPMVYRAQLRWKQKHFDWKIWYEWGLNDYDYQSVRSGVIYHMNSIRWRKERSQSQ